MLGSLPLFRFVFPAPHPSQMESLPSSDQRHKAQFLQPLFARLSSYWLQCSYLDGLAAELTVWSWLPAWLSAHLQALNKLSSTCSLLFFNHPAFSLQQEQLSGIRKCSPEQQWFQSDVSVNTHSAVRPAAREPMKAHGAPSSDSTVQELDAFPPRCHRCDKHLNTGVTLICKLRKRQEGINKWREFLDKKKVKSYPSFKFFSISIILVFTFVW